jgi:hypothetical protein
VVQDFGLRTREERNGSGHFRSEVNIKNMRIEMGDAACLPHICIAETTLAMRREDFLYDEWTSISEMSEGSCYQCKLHSPVTLFYPFNSGVRGYFPLTSKEIGSQRD